MPQEDWGREIPGGFYDDRIDPMTNIQRHVYRNARGTIIPSSTQVFSILGLSDFSRIDPATLEWKRCYGDAVHAAVEYLVTGDLDWDSLDMEIIAPVTGIEQRLKEMKFEVEATEERRIGNICGMEYGMTLDLRGTIEHQGVRRNAIIDEKTGTKKEQYWMWQLGSYLYPQPKVPAGWLGVVIQVDPSGRVTPHYLQNAEAAKREFQCLLATAILMLNNGYAKIGG